MITVDGLDDKLADAAFSVASKVFVANSTLHRALGIELDEYRAYLRPSFDAMVLEGLSVVAIDQNSSEVAGCLIASDFHQHLYASTLSVGKLRPLAALTSALCSQYRKVRTTKPGEVVLIDMGAVSGIAAGKGIYQKMRNAAQLIAWEKGYKRVVGELSSAATQHVVLERLGHQKVAEVRFTGFEVDGGYPFSSITDPESIVLAEGVL